MAKLRFLFDEKEEKEELKPIWEQRIRGIGELPKYEVPESTKLKFTADIGLGLGAKAGIGLPPLKPEEKPKTLLERIGVGLPTRPEELKMGIEVTLGTWEEQKRAKPELQDVEDFGNEVFKQVGERNQIAYIHEALTGVPKAETLREMEANWEKFKDINPDIDKRTWSEYFKQEGFWKTLITGPTKGKYDEAIRLHNQLIDIATKVAEPGKDLIGQLGWKGMILLTGARVTDAIYRSGLVVKEKWVTGEKLKAAVERARAAYIPETGKFKATLSGSDLAVVNRLKDVYRVTGGKIENIGLVKEWGVTERGIKVPQVTFLYAGLPADEIVRSLIKAGRVTADISRELSLAKPELVSQVIQNLSVASPAIAAKLGPELTKLIPEVEPKITEIPKLTKTERTILESPVEIEEGKVTFSWAEIAPKAREIAIAKLEERGYVKGVLLTEKGIELANVLKARVEAEERGIPIAEKEIKRPMTDKQLARISPNEELTLGKINGEDYYTDTRIMLRGKPENVPISKNKPDFEQVIVDLPKEETRIEPTIFSHKKDLEPLVWFDNKVAITERYYDLILKKFPGAEFRSVGKIDPEKPVPETPIKIYEEDKFVGVVMPYRQDLVDIPENVLGLRVKPKPPVEPTKPVEEILKKVEEPIAKEEIPKAEVKEPWQMTKKEYIGETIWIESAKNEHIKSVYQALKEGKPVPTEVLADYPELKAEVKPPPVIKPTPTPEVKPEVVKVEPKVEVKVKTYDLKKDLTTEQKIEGNKLIGRIHKIVDQKGLNKKEFISLKKKYGLSPHLATDTRRMTMPQLQAVLKAVERARPKIIRWQKVITKKTEGKIQSLKDSLIDKYQMTEKAYEDTLKDLGIYKEPRYIDSKHFITEQKGKELIYRLIDESNILRITEPLRIALEKNPEIKKLADIIDNRVKAEGERTLRDPSDLNSARSYFQILETISGAPFYTLYQDMINTHLENRAGLGHLINEFDKYKDIIKDEKELKKVEDWILAKSNLKGRPETPVNITPKEIGMAKKIEGILKDYQARARTEKFLDNLEHPEAMPQYLEYKKEIDKAKDIYESKGYDDLVKYMETQKWGVIKSGYDPLQVLSARVRAYKSKGLSIIFGKSHIKIRKDIEYKEQDKNIITRLLAYKRQMDNLSTMAPKVRALITLANKNLNKFKNPDRVRSNLGLFFRELKGYDRSTGWFERGINRLYAQAMVTIIMGSPPLAFRNLGQNFGLGHDKAMLVDPRNKKLTPDEIDFLDTYVQQAEFMRVDWFMVGEKPLPGLAFFTNIIKKVNLYPRSDIANRHWGFWGKINQVRMAFEADVSLKKKTEKAKFSDFSLLEQKRALQILAKDGQKAMEKYVSKCYVDDVHFLYERAQRSLAEMGPYGKVFGNLMLFPRAYWEKLAKFSKKMTGRNVPHKERARAFKVISSILIGGALVGVAYKKVTGRREPPYDPLILLAYEPGGLALASVEAVSDVYTDTIMAVRGDERALAALTTAVPKLADHFIPFYNYTLRGYEAFLADPLVNKNIDTYALRRLRMLIDEEYKVRGGAYSVERNAYEKWQYFLSGAGVDVAIKEREAEISKEPLKITIPESKKLKFIEPEIKKPTKLKFTF